MFPNPVDEQVPDWRRRMPNWGGPPAVDYSNGPVPAIPRVQQTPLEGDGPGPPVSAMGPAPAAMPPAYTPPPSSPMTGQAPDPVVQATGPTMSAPQAPPTVRAGSGTPEQDRLREMVQVGPRTSKLGTIAGLGVRALAGWASSPGRPPQVNTQRLDDWAERSPTGDGSWREGMARQGQLAGMEQGDIARSQAAAKAASEQAHTQSQIDLAKRQGGYYDARGEAVKQGAATAAATERDRLANANADRVLKEKLANQTAAGNKIRITLEQAKQYDISPTPEEEQQGFIEVDRRAWGRVLGQQAKPDTTKFNEDYWINQKANAKPGSAEYAQADAALKDFRTQSVAKRPHYATQAERSANTATGVKKYVGSLEKQYAGDYKKIREHIQTDDEIEDDLRADALRMATQQERLARDPKKKTSLTDMYAAPKGPPPVNGGGRGSPQPQAADPAGVRQFLR